MNDGDNCLSAMKLFERGEFAKSYITLKIICDKYKNTPFTKHNVEFLLQLYSAFDTASTTIGKKNEYVAKIDIDNYINLKPLLSQALLNHILKINCMALLRAKEYKKAKQYMPYIQMVTGPGIRPTDISFFKPGDCGKTLLIYTSGGIGDIIMYSRFLRQLCYEQPQNNILFLVDDNLMWIFTSAFVYTNLTFIPNSQRSIVPLKYDYHTNVTMLFHHLEIKYETLYIDYYIKNVPGNPISLDNIIEPNRKNVVINWCGNKTNIMEKYNRSIPLNILSRIFETTRDKINWISIQKNVTTEESTLLERYSIKNCGEILDNGGESYKDSITLLRAVDLVISTDTSIVHFAATMGIPCWCLLTIGCDWRWSYKNNKWYPDVKTFRQNRLSSWDNVISELSAGLESVWQNV